MNGNEIRERIVTNNEKIHEYLNKFVLSKELNSLMEENEELRKICPHEFEDGICKYCQVLEEFVNG